jgi:TrpR-related protein YerC/YecD
MSKRRFTEDSWRKEPWFKSLVAALKSCESEDELANFLRDIATLAELQAWSERLEIAKQLAKGKFYRDIAENTKASTTTVTRVARFLENGEGGYRSVLNTHRHHRLTLGSGEHHHAESTNPKRGERPASVLQKYLGKAKDQ